MPRVLTPILLWVCLSGPGCAFVYEIKRNLINEPLYACDEISGFVYAVALMYGRSLENVDVARVKKKLKDKHFARGVLREDIWASLEILGGQAVEASLLADALRAEGVRVDLVPVNPRLPRGLGWLRKVRYLRTLLNETLYLPSLARFRPNRGSISTRSGRTTACSTSIVVPAPADGRSGKAGPRFGFRPRAVRQ